MSRNSASDQGRSDGTGRAHIPGTEKRGRTDKGCFATSESKERKTIRVNPKVLVWPRGPDATRGVLKGNGPPAPVWACGPFAALLWRDGSKILTGSLATALCTSPVAVSSLCRMISSRYKSELTTRVKSLAGRGVR